MSLNGLKIFQHHSGNTNKTFLYNIKSFNIMYDNHHEKSHVNFNRILGSSPDNLSTDSTLLLSHNFYQ